MHDHRVRGAHTYRVYLVKFRIGRIGRARRGVGVKNWYLHRGTRWGVGNKKKRVIPDASPDAEILSTALAHRHYRIITSSALTSTPME